MRSSTKSENCENSDNMNNNTVEADDDRDRPSGDDVIDIASSESINKLHNQSGNCESELTLRADHAQSADDDKSAKVNVYEQVSIWRDCLHPLLMNISIQIARRKETIAMEREARVQRVLTIITSAFLFCWTPFFLSVLLSTIFKFECDILNSIFLWLGYFNSSLNPILYNIFNPEFRSAFKKILLGQSHKSSFYKRQKL